MKIIKAKPGDFIVAGQQGEELARRVEFDIAEWERLYGLGTVQLLVKRMTDETFYPVAIEQDQGVAIWTVTVPETSVAGKYHTYELRYYAGETLAKAVGGRFSINEAFVGEEGEVPEVHKGWVEQVIATGAGSLAAQKAAEAARDEADKRAKDALESANAAARSEQESKELAEDISKAVAAGVETIQTAGNTQVERVAQEGATQVEAVGALAKQAKENADAAALSEKNSKASEEAAANSAKQAEDVVNNAAWIAAEVDEDGHLIVTQSDNFNGATFAINENGNLEVSYT